MKLHLGCGRTILPGWVNLDAVPGEGVDTVADLDDCAATKLPFDDDTFDEIMGIHLIEHLRNPLPFMAELWRVAKDGATVMFATPYGSSDDAWEDQTHVRPYFLGSWQAFSAPYYWRADYGYTGDWQCEEIAVEVPRARYADSSPDAVLAELMSVRNVATQMTALLRAVKPARAAERDEQVPPRVSFALVD